MDSTRYRIVETVSNSLVADGIPDPKTAQEVVILLLLDHPDWQLEIECYERKA